jgi:hypothetical protein
MLGLREYAAVGGGLRGQEGGQAAAVRRHGRVLTGRDEGLDAAAKQTGSVTGPVREPELRMELLTSIREREGAWTISEVNRHLTRSRPGGPVTHAYAGTAEAR